MNKSEIHFLKLKIYDVNDNFKITRAEIGDNAITTVRYQNLTNWMIL